MNSHYHLLVKSGPVGIDRALQSLHMSYAKYVNYSRDRAGSVFRARPGVKIVLNDRYILQLVPYIHNNAVKAGIVLKPEDYPWHTDELYRTGNWQYGPLKCWEYPPHFTGKNRKRLYLELLRKNNQHPPQGRGYVGDSREWKEIDRRAPKHKNRFSDRRNRKSMDEIAQHIAKKGNIASENLKISGRKQPAAKLRQEAMVEMYKEGYGPTQIGEYFKRDKGTVVYAVKKAEINL
ncbi:MAG: helix-turn-helix domain-containing protein [Elusimicrobiota bacterium]|nr:helix-turn-helix domain-containing protein [Elusimicrobiota bacterium]